MGLEEANGSKGVRRERSNKSMGSIRCRKVRMGYSKLEVMKVKKVRG